MLTSLEFPFRYIQGTGALKSSLTAQISSYGQKVFVVYDAVAEKKIPDQIHGIDTSIFSVKRHRSSGACTLHEINRIRQSAQACQMDCIVGLGGVQLLDAVKVVANELGLPTILVPIPIASESTSSNISIVYSPDGGVERYISLKKCPDVILVDLCLIIGSPVRYLVSAMGSALAIWFEAEIIRKTGDVRRDGFSPSVIAYDLAWLCYEKLLEYGPQAKLDYEANQKTEALEHIVETSTVLSGICFSNYGLAAPHAIYNGLTKQQETLGTSHGEKLAFGTLVSLYISNTPVDIIKDFFSFCASVGLPTTLKDIGIDGNSNAALARIAKHACSTTQVVPDAHFSIDPATVIEALRQADHDGSKHSHAKQSS